MSKQDFSKQFIESVQSEFENVNSGDMVRKPSRVRPGGRKKVPPNPNLGEDLRVVDYSSHNPPTVIPDKELAELKDLSDQPPSSLPINEIDEPPHSNQTRSEEAEILEEGIASRANSFVDVNTKTQTDDFPEAGTNKRKNGGFLGFSVLFFVLAVGFFAFAGINTLASANTQEESYKSACEKLLSSAELRGVETEDLSCEENTSIWQRLTISEDYYQQKFSDLGNIVTNRLDQLEAELIVLEEQIAALEEQLRISPSRKPSRSNNLKVTHISFTGYVEDLEDQKVAQLEVVNSNIEAYETYINSGQATVDLSSETQLLNTFKDYSELERLQNAVEISLALERLKAKLGDF